LELKSASPFGFGQVSHHIDKSSYDRGDTNVHHVKLELMEDAGFTHILKISSVQREGPSVVRTHQEQVRAIKYWWE
jgi:hypothetical protein